MAWPGMWMMSPRLPHETSPASYPLALGCTCIAANEPGNGMEACGIVVEIGSWLSEEDEIKGTPTGLDMRRGPQERCIPSACFLVN